MLINWVLYRKRAASHSSETARVNVLLGITAIVECYGSTNLRWFFLLNYRGQKIDICKIVCYFYYLNSLSSSLNRDGRNDKNTHFFGKATRDPQK